MKQFIHILCLISALIAAIGAINWMTTSYGTNLVEKITGKVGAAQTANKVIYTIVGICGILVVLCQAKWLFSGHFLQESQHSH